MTVSGTDTAFGLAADGSDPGVESVVVEMSGIWKRFPGVTANAGIDLDLRAGEVHALLGENGAGKTTLMRILSGLYRPDQGTIRIDGGFSPAGSTTQAIRAGIGMVHQNFLLVDTLTAAENIHLGWGETPVVLSRAALCRRTAAICARFGLHVDPGTQVQHLSVGEQQRVEILRVLARGARILILDEPTSVLTPLETEELFAVIRSLASEGRTIVFISHKLDEVLAISDRVTVLRDGRKVLTCPTSGCDHQTLALLMVGEEVVSQDLSRHHRDPGAVIFRMRGVNATGERGLPALVDVDLEIHEGEILGVAGVAGNGQSELAEVVTGLRAPQSGTIEMGGASVTGWRPQAAAQAGVGHIPEDRMGVGLVGDASVTDNAILRVYGKPPVSKGPLLDRVEAERFTTELLDRAGVRVASLQVPVRLLSGGNQQRLLASRETLVASRVLVAVHPTRGLDIVATDSLRQVLVDHRNQGGAVLLISEDLDEILLLSDRVVVMFRGTIVGESLKPRADRHRIGLWMGGASTEVGGCP